MESLRNSDYKRVIVFQERIDNVLGVLHVKDLFLNPDKPIEELVRNPLVFPQKKTLISMLAEFRRSRAHMAVVVDEFGGSAGIITLQDVLEEIVRQQEQTLEQQLLIKKVKENEYVVSGNTEISRLNKELGIYLPAGEARTIAGYIINVMKRIPEQGESLHTDSLKLVVEQKTQRRLTLVRVIKKYQPGHTRIEKKES